MSTITLAPQAPVADSFQGSITHLILRCGRGDETALGELFDLTFFFVAATVGRSSLCCAGIDDEVVAAFRRMWRRASSYQPEHQAALDWVFDQALEASVADRPNPYRVVTA
jgi:hypothetical protein